MIQASIPAEQQGTTAPAPLTESSEMEGQRLAEMALLGELTGSVAHEFNNILNNVMLHLAILEQKGLPAELRSEAAQVKQAGRQAAALVKKLQQYSQSRTPPPVALDLQALLRETVRPPVRLVLAEDLPAVLGNAGDLRRVLTLLVAHAASLSGKPEEILVRTRLGERGVRLEVQDNGPAISTEQQARQFEPFIAARSGDDGVCLAVCKNLLRRMQSTIHGENRPAGGVVYIIELRRAGVTA